MSYVFTNKALRKLKRMLGFKNKEEVDLDG